MIKVAAHPDGKHYLALTAGGQVGDGLFRIMWSCMNRFLSNM